MLQSIDKFKKYLLEYRFDSDYEEFLQMTKNMSEYIEEDSKLKSQVGVYKRKKKCEFVYEVTTISRK